MISSRLLKYTKPFQDFLIKNQDPRRRVLAALSGGVDSAVAAALLIKAGYEVTGAFIKCYTNDSRIGADTDANGRRIFLDSSPIRGGQVGSYSDQSPPLTPPYRGRIDEIPLTPPDASCWIEDRREAMRVAAKLGIKLLTFDFEKEYRRAVVDYLFREYKTGRTPNPDVICNKLIKFPLLLREAKRRGFDYVATGHYARLGREIPNPKSQILNKSKIQNPNLKSEILNLKLLEGVDKNKDQSYFLHQLKQTWLKDILFPLGNITKNEVRLLAKNMGLPVADREESMGICFVGEVKMMEFLSSRIKSKPGNIVLSSGEIVGRHEGLAFYTIGQRISIKSQIPSQISKPIYVVDKRIRTNEIVVGFENNPLLYKKETIVKNVNWLAGMPPKLPLKCLVRLRHRQPLQKCGIRRIQANKKRMKANQVGAYGNTLVRVFFDAPQRAVTPGQFAVFYQGEECLGGGVIVGNNQ